MRAALADAGPFGGRGRLHQCPWHRHTAQRRGREPRRSRPCSAARATRVPVSSIKSMVGHALGAAWGAIEAVAPILCPDPRQLHPLTVNLHDARSRVRPRLTPRRRPQPGRRRHPLQQLRLRRQQHRPRVWVFPFFPPPPPPPPPQAQLFEPQRAARQKREAARRFSRTGRTLFCASPRVATFGFSDIVGGFRRAAADRAVPSSASKSRPDIAKARGKTGPSGSHAKLGQGPPPVGPGRGAGWSQHRRIDRLVQKF